jgi:hypothetical protein
MNFSVKIDLFSCIESKKSMFEVIQRSKRDLDVALEVICECSADECEFDRNVAAAVVIFTSTVTLC